MRTILVILVVAVLIGSAVLLTVAHAPQGAVHGTEALAPVAVKAGDTVWAISFVRARPGQRERLERYLKANWLALDALALREKRIVAYRMLRADADAKEGWDYAVIIEYADRQAMAGFVPFYIGLARERPQVRVEGLDFADLGEITQQKTVTPVTYDPVHD